MKPVVKSVWKYALSQVDNTFQIPERAKVLSVGRVQGEPALWALVDINAPKVDRRFLIIGTGHESPDKDLTDATFIGTVIMPMPGIELVLHVFELVK